MRRCLIMTGGKLDLAFAAPFWKKKHLIRSLPWMAD